MIIICLNLLQLYLLTYQNLVSPSVEPANLSFFGYYFDLHAVKHETPSVVFLETDHRSAHGIFLPFLLRSIIMRLAQRMKVESDSGQDRIGPLYLCCYLYK